MRGTEHTIVANEVAWNRATRSGYPRVLFLPLAGTDREAALATLADSLTAEGWMATNRSEAVAATDLLLDRLSWLPGSVRKTLVRFQSLISQIPRYDLVHIACRSAGQIICEAMPSIVLARFFGKKVVLQFLSAEIEPLLERRRKWLMPFLRLADRIVVGSRYLQKVFGRLGLKADVVIRPLALDRLKHRSLSRLQPKILVNCALEPDQNVGCAIRAFRLVKQKYPRAELVIVGGGSQRASLENQARQDSFCDVEFRGGLSGDELTGTYHECDLFLHTPLVDETPAALVHAFAAGLPVVVTDADGVLPMVRDGLTGLIAAVGDHVGLADAMIELVENPELVERLSRRGKTEAGRHVWSRVRQDWVNLYTGLAKNSIQ